MLCLIDGDIVLHRVGYTTDNDPEWVAKARCDEMMDGILTATGADEFRVYLSDSRENNFRRHIYPLYKANRKDQKRPVHYIFLKNYLKENWGAMVSYGMEADDSLGIDLTEAKGNAILCSIDKDLLQVPGRHYNFVKGEMIDIDPKEGITRFYTQMLVGDTSDNIRGCRGIGPKKAEKALEGLVEETDLLEAVYNLYEQQEKDKSTEEILQHILLIGRLLKIKTSEMEPLWNFSRLPIIQEAFAASTHHMPEEDIQYMEPISAARG